jgi:hypothetical protein
MTKVERMGGESRDEASVRRAWEPMSLTRIGTFGDVLQGATGPQGDGGGTMKTNP